MPHLPTSSPPRMPKRQRPSSAARGYGPQHRKIRKRFLAEHPICQNCNAEFSEELHHADGDNTNIAEENLRAWCGDCHDRHHAMLRFHL